MNSQAGDGECSKSFVKSTNHDPSVAMPGSSRAAIAKSGPYIPDQEGKSESPENDIEAIEREIECWREHAQMVADAGDDQHQQCENRDRQELDFVLDT